MILRSNVLKENQAPERLVAATRLFGLKQPRHERTTCSRQLEMQEHAELQVLKWSVTEAMVASSRDGTEYTVSPLLRVLCMYDSCSAHVLFVPGEGEQIME